MRTTRRHILTREELYERVWEMPLVSLAERLETRGATLSLLCRQAGVPLPSRGHWQRLSAGKKVVREPLPPRPPGALAVITIGWPTSWWRRPSEMLVDPPPIRPEFSGSVEEVVAVAAAKIGDIPIGRHLRRGQARRYRLLNAIRLGLARAGAQMWSGQDHLWADIGAVQVAFALDPLDDGEDRFCCSVSAADGDAPKDFIDIADRQLEGQIFDIVAALLTTAEWQYRARAERDYQHAVERRQSAVSDAQERRQEARRLWEQRRLEREERRRDLLISQAQAWRTAQDIRGLVKDILLQAQDEAARTALTPWAEWAHSEADAMDPVKQGALLPPADK